MPKASSLFAKIFGKTADDAGRGSLDRDAFERKLYIVRKSSGHAIRALRLSNAGEL